MSSRPGCYDEWTCINTQKVHTNQYCTWSTVILSTSLYLQESRWGRAGWGTGASIQSRPGKFHCRFWSGCGSSDCCRRSSPPGAGSRSSALICCPGRYSTDSASSAQTHWCEGQNTEPWCRGRRPAGARQPRTWYQETRSIILPNTKKKKRSANQKDESKIAQRKKGIAKIKIFNNKKKCKT